MISGTVGAVLSSESAADATEQNAANVAATNRQNLAMYNLSRGSGGNYALPDYFGTQEAALGQNANSVYNAIQAQQGSPTAQLQQYSNAVANQQGAMTGVQNTVNSIFNGGMTNQLLGYAAPVQSANLALANTQASGINEGLNQTINALNAQNQSQGFTGGSSFANNRLLGATVGARQQAAGVIGAANLQNAQQTAGIQAQGIQTELGNLNAPASLAQQQIGLLQLPGQAAAANFNTALSPYNFFRAAPPQPYVNSQLPMVAPNSMGQAIANGIGGANQQVGNYFANQSLINQLNGGAGAYAGGSGSGGSLVGSGANPSYMDGGTMSSASAASASESDWD